MLINDRRAVVAEQSEVGKRPVLRAFHDPERHRAASAMVATQPDRGAIAAQNPGGLRIGLRRRRRRESNVGPERNDREQEGNGRPRHAAESANALARSVLELYRDGKSIPAMRRCEPISALPPVGELFILHPAHVINRHIH